MKLRLTVVLMVVGMIVPGVLSAAEIITEEDIIQKVVVEEQLVKTADNFLILFDSSNSMNTPYERGATKTKYEVAKEMLEQKIEMIPDLGYNAGLYTYTPWQELYPMGPFDKAKFISAMDSLPAEPKGPTSLTQGLRELDSVLSGLSGKTVVFIFNDGTYTQIEGMKVPPTYTEELANKYNVCFYMISYARRGIDQKLLKDMAKANACSRVIAFRQFVENPEYIIGALYVVKATERIDTITEMKITGLKVGYVLFASNKADVQTQYESDLKALGEFLRKNPDTYTLLLGYTDNIGLDEYNLELSKRRAESVANYLMNKLGIDEDQIVLNWYGKDNPVAGNDTAEGRAQNRRVEIAVGGI